MSLHERLENILSTYETAFGEVQDDFPPPVQPGPRRRTRIAGYISPIDSDALLQPTINDVEVPKTELLADGSAICMVEFCGGVATASMLSDSEKLI